MSNNSSKRRPINLSLLALTLLCLAFPFAAVSCESPMATISAEYTGWDLAFGGEATIEVSGKADKPASASKSEIPAQPLMIVAVLVLLAGLVVLARSKAGYLLGIGVGVLGALFLVVNQVAIQDFLASKLSETENLKPAAASDMVESRVGFWLTLLLTLGVAAYNATALVLGARAARAAQSAPPSTPGPTQSGPSPTGQAE
ncbi:hypothetical protein FHS29_005211 [Saccharothrix tamanrassetensis]|uniref:Uncharacterized protein n=1 Tax=Saccharothrix tamanrassetensis TaxID=1051531 RepID=A0A841CNW4_9PSEU|nr:hypothetical protein [Saccharothrix tamanrassetensis]MBB5958603.1 hypothetical protein [Saccharothrix tamanrassetensis]